MEAAMRKPKQNVTYLRTPRLMIRKPRRRQSSDPVKSLEMNEQIKDYLRTHGRYGYRNWMIWVLGTNIGKRGADYLQLRIGDVWDGQNVYDKIELLEHKTNKNGEAYISDPIRLALKEYILSLSSRDPNSYLFPSQKGTYLLTKCYGRELKKVQEALDLNIRLRTHSARKTKGYHTYMDVYNNPRIGYAPIDVVQKMLNHDGKRDTLQYIGINEDVLREEANRVVL